MVYRGERTKAGCLVWCIDGEAQDLLPPRLDLWNSWLTPCATTSEPSPSTSSSRIR